jgi:cellulose biosynthesis protein BcsQ
MEISEVKITELQKYVDMSKPGISKYFKSLDSGVTFSNNRIIGISPEAVSSFLKKYTSLNFDKPSINLTGNLCGGVGKTSSAYNLAMAHRRITSRKDSPIVLIDGDSQASFTQIVTGSKADDHQPILIDYIENKAKLNDVLFDLGNSIYMIKSNLNNAFLDKTINRPSDIKNIMKNLYNDIFQTLGVNTKIYQDHTPQLSNLFASSVSALYQMPQNVNSNIIIPVRSDDFAIQGANYIINEINDLCDTYNFSRDRIKIHCFFSAVDRRISTTDDAIKRAMSNETLQPHLSTVAVRYSSEIPKTIMNCSNVFSQGKINNATEDYQELLQSIYN